MPRKQFDELLAEIPPDWTRPLFRVVTGTGEATIEMTLARPHRIIQLWPLCPARNLRKMTFEKAKGQP